MTSTTESISVVLPDSSRRNNQLVERIAQVLKTRGAPMHASEIAGMIGVSPVLTVALLSASPEFKRVDRATYTLTTVQP